MDAQSVRIVMFGDSIVASARVSVKWPDRLAWALNEHGTAALAFNLGVGGNTTEHGRARFSDVLDLSPAAVCMMFGTNDAAIDVWADRTEPRVPIETYVENLKAMITELGDRGSIPILLTPPPMEMTDELAKLYGKPPYTEQGFNFMLDRYVDRLRGLADSLDAPLVDISERFRQAAADDPNGLASVLRDGMHPNQRGSDLIAETVLPVLLNCLQNRR